MKYYEKTTQTPNVLFDDLLKILTESELKVLLTIIRKTIGQVDRKDSSKRLERAWISQKLFMRCCNLSGRAISNAIEKLVQKGLIEVTNFEGDLLNTKSNRKGVKKLYFTSLLGLEYNPRKDSEGSYKISVNKSHTIKLNHIKQSCYNRSQGSSRLSDIQRFNQIQQEIKTRNIKDSS